VERNIDDIPMDLDMALPVGCLLTEFLTNSFKHAFPHGGGAVSIKLEQLRAGNLELTVRDNGIGLPKDIDFNNPKSMGLRLVSIFVDQLNGVLNAQYKKAAEFRVAFPNRVKTP
jgi:two-component sensor histidine kinase